MSYYAKKREPVRAAQWTGEMTPEMTELLDQRESRIERIEGNRQLVFVNRRGPGRFAEIGDWIYSSSGEDLSVIGNEQFRALYEKVDATGRTSPLTHAEHEADARKFMQAVDAVLIGGLQLSRERHVEIFRERDRLLSLLAQLLVDRASLAVLDELGHVKEKLGKIIKEL